MTGCEHVQEQPYIVVFQAQDRPAPPNNPLVDVEAWLITVKGPRPQNLMAQPDNRGALLSWDDYRLQCPGFTPAQFDEMEIIIWRREGCLDTIACQQDPAMLGYQPIGQLPIDATAFRDDGPLALGLGYSYVLTVNFPGTRGGVSQASAEQCVFLPITSPLITNVSVSQTASSGTIDVRWIFPPDLGTDSSFYAYNIYRAEGLRPDSLAFQRLNANPIPASSNGNPPDPNEFISFVDEGTNALLPAPNTEANPYAYRVELLGGNNINQLTSVAFSDPASSVRLEATAAENSIILTWDYEVPWSNRSDLSRNVPGHIILRRSEQETNFQIVDTVFIGQPRYVDNGQFSGECLNPELTYFYQIRTLGSYYNQNLNPRIIPLDIVLENLSQIDAARPLDEIPPIAPVLSIAAPDCGFLDEKPCFEDPTLAQRVENLITWQRENTQGCDNVSVYRLFFRAVGQADYDFSNPVYEGTDTFFVHRDLPLFEGTPSQAGCYVLVAVDQGGNESPLSNEVCQDNCLYYELPNVITPDNNLKNNVFRPCPVPLYVESVDFTVYNRWGGQIYQQTNPQGGELEWNALDDNGKEVTSGVYYYLAKVRFFTQSPERAYQEFKGWVKVIRSTTFSAE
ncbi:MAG: hypothetical protein HC880_15270 [Bacteroidia bacterium]|nr:hypothetical protein [Bacteroidia bacterium]